MSTLLRFCLMCLTLVAMSPSSALALDITSIRFGAHPDKQRAVIELNGTADFRTFVLTSPNRLIVDMPDFDWKAGTVQIPPSVPVKAVRFGPLGGGLSRLVIETNKPVMIQSAFMLPKKENQLDRLVIDFKVTTPAVMKSLENQVQGSLQSGPVKAGQALTPAATTADSPSSARPTGNKTDDNNLPFPTALPKSKSGKSAQTNPIPSAGLANTSPAKGKEKPLIIIDPGHGGQDPGALGANGMYEKTIVLAVGKELARQLEESGAYRVKLTRDADFFIPLHQRVVIARKSKGDLFISLHADSIRNAAVTGASVYTLSDKASDKETEKLAERENKSDMIAGVDLSNQEQDVANILINLAARDTMNQSRFLANGVIDNLESNGVKVIDHNHRSAGFAVLKAMDIPSILVEMGYLTNPQEVALLSSPSHRRQIAQALKASVDAYFQKVGK